MPSLLQPDSIFAGYLQKPRQTNASRAARTDRLTVNKELNRRVRDANGIEDLVQVVRYKAVTRPLREEGDGDDNPYTLAVAR